MTEVAPDELRRHVERLHDCRAELCAKVSVHEKFEGKTAWEGVVHVFDLSDHPTADVCYAWSSGLPGSRKRRFYAVVHTDVIDSPAKAVRAAIVSDARNDNAGTY